MKFTVSWLKEHLDTECSSKEILEKLNMIGLEVESYANPKKLYEDFSVCKVISLEKHPDANKLNKCLLDTKNGHVSVICGANNVKVGMKAVFAPVGTYVPGLDIYLKSTKIRGIQSDGMLVSEKELLLSDEHDGIIELDNKAEVGLSIDNFFDLGDEVIEIGVTPNRSDALGVNGIARDLSASGIGSIKQSVINEVKEKIICDKSFSIDPLLEKEENITASFRLIKNVNNVESPKWLQDRLKSIGLRPISSLVDITNYLTFDSCRPLHVFDADKIGRDIYIRKAISGEKIQTLDDSEYNLDPSVTVIADDQGADSIAGIIGGVRTSCGIDTKNVLIESAIWDKINTAETGRKLGIITDARYRYERGVDPDFIVSGIEIATNMIQDICGGEASEIISLGEYKPDNKIINFNISEIERLVGISVDKESVIKILDKLGFMVKDMNENLSIKAPSWRHDISEKACIVEEIIRIIGTDKIQSKPLAKNTKIKTKILSNMQNRRRTGRRALASRGMVEAITWSFIPHNHAVIFGGGQKKLQLINPISSELNTMRPSLFPNLIASAKRNHDRGLRDISLFELGQCYKGVNPEDQVDNAAGIRFGNALGMGGSGDWREPKREYNVFDVKEDVITLLAVLGMAENKYQLSTETPPWYHPGKSGVLRQGPKNIIAYFGEIHPRVIKKFGLSGSLLGFEVMLNNIPDLKNKLSLSRGRFHLSDLMSVSRDFAFVVDEEINADKLIKVIKNIDQKIISEVKLFDVYRGKNIDSNKKSIAVEVKMQPEKLTFTDQEIDAISSKIIKEVSNSLGAVLRS